jgi:hypothetical protein
MLPSWPISVNGPPLLNRKWQAPNVLKTFANFCCTSTAFGSADGHIFPQISTGLLLKMAILLSFRERKDAHAGVSLI